MKKPDEPRGLAAYQARVADAKRGSILDAAVARFLEHGYHRTSLESVARAAGVSTGTLFKHFPTKAALFGAVMARAWDNEPGAVAPMPAAGDPRRGLTAIGRDYARLLRAPGVEALFRVVIAEAPRFPELGRELYERGKQPYLARMRTYLEAETGRGLLRIDAADLARAKREFLGMINDQVFWPRFLVVDFTVDDAEVERIVGSAVETFMARYGAR